MAPTAPRSVRVQDLPELDPAQIERLVTETVNRDHPAGVPARRARGARPWEIGLGAAAAAVAFALASSTGVVPAPQAQAWTPVPGAPSADDVALHEPQCIESSVPPTGTAREFTIGGPGETPSLGAEVTLTAPPDTTVPTIVLAERRGQSFAMVTSNGGFCLFFAGAMSAGTGSWTPPARPIGDDLTILMSGFAGGSGQSPQGDMDDIVYDQAYTAVIAIAGPDIVAADVTTAGGQHVTATVSDGWVLAWWPTTDDPATISTTTGAGLQRSQPATAP